MTRAIIPAFLIAVMMIVIAACGGDDPAPTATTAPQPEATPQPTASAAPTAAPTTAPATSVPAPTAEATPTAVPTAAAPAAVLATARPAPTPIPPTPTPAATEPPPADATEEELLAQYAAQTANGPGAIFVGSPDDMAAYAQLIGPPVHEELVFLPPGEGQQQQFQQLFQVGIFGLAEFGVPGHQFIYTSDYYQELIERANLLSPTELTSSGESIEIQHVCLSRTTAPCVIMQAYMAPRLAERTQGQVSLTITSLTELGLSGQDTLRQIESSTLDMANVYTGYVAGALPAIEVQTLWGMGPDWETTYLALAEMVPDIERMLLDETGGAIVNRNWFAGVDNWFYSNSPIMSVEDFHGQKIRTHAAALSSLIEGLGGEPVFIPPAATILPSRTAR